MGRAGKTVDCREQLEEARRTLHQSIDRFPCNWGAWKALQVASGGADAPLADPTLPKHWMREFYLASLCLESRENEEGLGRLQVSIRRQHFESQGINSQSQSLGAGK